MFGKLEPGTRTELAGRDITLIGGFEMGFDFSTDGSLVVSDRTFATWVRAWPITVPRHQRRSRKLTLAW